MGAGSPQLGALLAKLLADVGTSLAEPESGQQRLGQTLSESIGGLATAQAFNRRRDLTQNIQGALREPGVSPGVPATSANLQAGGAFVSPDLAPGITTATGAVAQAPAIAPRQEIDPLQALALGQEGTEELIRTQQQERMLVQRQLERQQDYSNRLKVLEETQKNRERFFKIQFGAEEARDVARGGPQRRRAEADLLGLQLGEERAEKAARPTTPQELEATELRLRQERAAATSAEEKARISGELADLELQKAQRDVGPDAAELTQRRNLAERAMAPIVLNTLVERLGETEEVNKLIAIFDDPATLRDETARRTNFISMVSLLTPNEKADLDQQFGVSLDEIVAGRQPFGAIGLSGRLGTNLAQPLQPIEPPTATNPAIDPIGTAAVADAVAGARNPNSLLRRNGR